MERDENAQDWDLSERDRWMDQFDTDELEPADVEILVAEDD